MAVWLKKVWCSESSELLCVLSHKLFCWQHMHLRMYDMVNGFQSLIYSELVNFSSPLGYHDCLEHCLESSSLIGFSTSPCVVSSPWGCASCFNECDVSENVQNVEAHINCFMWEHSSSSLTELCSRLQHEPLGCQNSSLYGWCTWMTHIWKSYNQWYSTVAHQQSNMYPRNT